MHWQRRIEKLANGTQGLLGAQHAAVVRARNRNDLGRAGPVRQQSMGVVGWDDLVGLRQYGQDPAAGSARPEVSLEAMAQQSSAFAGPLSS